MIELEHRSGAELSSSSAAEPRRRRPLLVAAVMVLILLLLAITPPLLNVSRYQRRIVTSMSESLGRPVHLDRVNLHLLPVPGFTLQNFVVSEDPAFGNEPTIRANEVVATLRFSSLWKRRVEFSRVNFREPSVNLVRSADGRWNLEGVLLRASQVNTAPTAQQRAGSAPRFPYIEATGGRINLKLGQEKMPFSLTEADFALWLPSPQVWRVRLEGKPTRTDSNIGDPGIVRLEGTLQRAARMQDVPVDLHASWYDAPLGEASRLVSGDDRDWRGTLHADLWLKGPLGAAAVRAQTTLVDLRRADFVPVHTLDRSVTCTSRADLPDARLTELACTVPTTGEQPIELDADAVDLTHPQAARATLEMRKLPLEWIFEWMRLFSARIPAEPGVHGTVDAILAHESGDRLTDWTGTVAMKVPVQLRRADGEPIVVKSATSPSTQTIEASLDTSPAGWSASVSPTVVRLGPSAELALSAQASKSGYNFTAVGTASAAQLEPILHAFPQLADGTGFASGQGSAPADTVRLVSLSCVRPLNGGQVCSAPTPVSRHPARRSLHR